MQRGQLGSQVIHHGFDGDPVLDEIQVDVKAMWAPALDRSVCRFKSLDVAQPPQDSHELEGRLSRAKAPWFIHRSLITAVKEHPQLRLDRGESRVRRAGRHPQVSARAVAQGPMETAIANQLGARDTRFPAEGQPTEEASTNVPGKPGSAEIELTVPGKRSGASDLPHFLDLVWPFPVARKADLLTWRIRGSASLGKARMPAPSDKDYRHSSRRIGSTK